MAAQTIEPTEGASQTLRLTFEYRGTDVRLVARQSVEMLPPPSDRTDEYSGHSGFWIEVRDAASRVLYRRIMHNPIELFREAPSGDPQRPFTRVPNESKQGVFTIVVPALNGARDVLLMGSPPNQPALAAKEILRVDLRQGPETKKGAQ